jgi:hypothetical protein
MPTRDGRTCKKQASTDQANCAAVASLPSLRQKLKELQQQQQ